MSMMRARVRGHRWVDHPAAAVMKARVPGQWVDCPAAVVMEAREQGRCWIDHPAVAVMEARVQGRHWVDRTSVGRKVVSEVTPEMCMPFIQKEEGGVPHTLTGSTAGQLTPDTVGRLQEAGGQTSTRAIRQLLQTLEMDPPHLELRN
ncbi:hypothetical protein ACOMHN_016533 [Nucella lapillus]